MINELVLIENIDALFIDRIVLFGAGWKGIRIVSVASHMGISIHSLCDCDEEKWGGNIGGVMIISPEELKQLDAEERVTIIITSIVTAYITEIEILLKQLQLRSKNIFTSIGLEAALIQNINDARLNRTYRELYAMTSEIKGARALSNYTLSLLSYTYVEFLYAMEHYQNILIYIATKVGSTSVYQSLNKLNVPVTHIHSLALSSNEIINLNPIAGQRVTYCKDKFIDILREEKLKIITLVREPVSRDFSSLFQRLDTIAGYSIISTIMSPGSNLLESCVAKIKEWFINDYTYGFQFDWFDQELKAVFGIDVYEHNFDKEKGYAIINQGNTEVLIMKLEKLNTLEGVIAKFAGISDFKLEMANETMDKPYRSLYQNVKDNIKIPREIFSFYYENNPRMDHFYSEEEKKQFLKKWARNIED